MNEKVDTGLIQSIDDWKLDIFANYSGTDRKNGVISPDGARYMLKFSEKKAPKNDFGTSYINNVISEYISSHILSISGYETHETSLVTRGGELAVACRNFEDGGNTLIEFGTFMRKYYDSADVGRIPSIEQIYETTSTDPQLSANSDFFMRCYWERFVGDALVGNFDRHKGNFGYLVGKNGDIRVSPIYDNGSTLFPNLSDEGMASVISEPKEIMRRVKLFPKAALTARGKKVRYYDMMSSGIYPELTDAVRETVPRIREKMPDVHEFINEQAFLSDTRKSFYHIMLDMRMEYILEPSYKHSVSPDISARERIESGTEYSEEDFEKEWAADSSDNGIAAIRDKWF